MLYYLNSAARPALQLSLYQERPDIIGLQISGYIQSCHRPETIPSGDPGTASSNQYVRALFMKNDRAIAGMNARGLRPKLTGYWFRRLVMEAGILSGVMANKIK